MQLCSITANLGDSCTIVTHPASTTHSKLSDAEREAVGHFSGIDPRFSRVGRCVGHPRDTLQALEQSK
ncbi:MAG: hypothetical protein R3C26_16590 [Calditrichia bacterium]